MPAPYRFQKDGKTDDGPELFRFLITDRQPLASLSTGRYRLRDGTLQGPGSLGVLPSNITYRDEGDGSITLIVS